MHKLHGGLNDRDHGPGRRGGSFARDSFVLFPSRGRPSTVDQGDWSEYWWRAITEWISFYRFMQQATRSYQQNKGHLSKIERQNHTWNRYQDDLIFWRQRLLRVSTADEIQTITERSMPHNERQSQQQQQQHDVPFKHSNQRSGNRCVAGCCKRNVVNKPTTNTSCSSWDTQHTHTHNALRGNETGSIHSPENPCVWCDSSASCAAVTGWLGAT